MKKIYKLKGIDCPSCALDLECDLECFCKSAKCSYAKSTLKVVFKKEDGEKILKTLKKHQLEISE